MVKVRKGGRKFEKFQGPALPRWQAGSASATIARGEFKLDESVKDSWNFAVTFIRSKRTN